MKYWERHYQFVLKIGYVFINSSYDICLEMKRIINV